MAPRNKLQVPDDLEAQRDAGHSETAGRKVEVPVWERDDAPPGSHAGSLLDYEGGKPVGVAGPTHYHHLANGKVVLGYGIGTHYTEPDPEGGGDLIFPIIGRY